MLIDFPAPKAGPLTFSPEQRQTIVEFTYRYPVEVSWAQCDDGDEYAGLLSTKRRDCGEAVAYCFPVPSGWCVADGDWAEDWTFRTFQEAVEWLDTLI